MPTPHLRQLALSAQGLSSPNQFGTGLAGTQAAIEHLGYVQIDTIAVIERAHHHVLWTRVADYSPQWLNQLVASGQIFEYWFHAAAYLPMRDYRFAQHRMGLVRDGLWQAYRDVPTALLQEIRQKIALAGPLSTRALNQGHGKSQGWWDWGPAKRAIEKLFLRGEVMVRERQGMEKIYDLTERVLPAGVDTRAPSRAEYAEYLFALYLRNQAVITLKQLTHLQADRHIKALLQEQLAAAVHDGRVQPLNDTHSTQAKTPWGYVNTAHHYQESASNTPPQLHLLSPFDNAIIHRERLQQLFGFQYTLECYVPAPKRQFGYFCLPILYGHDFVGRLDCKAHRREARLEILSLHLSADFKADAAFSQALRARLQDLAVFNQCQVVDERAITAQLPRN
ncbi:winged helix-turn-helix domain-containing protein [Chitinibacter sp. ZOR0017]|uniref:winged helix-turn-helix domain-containing protein n=1 Tax=Chitinibacter sp. ZOR0017 TaxID=1339254 RepID=UPI0006480B9B|nr:crosslink repair DNA glycosylase YcaQ family protein [Chitinibacter sp. ZOR0017]